MAMIKCVHCGRFLSPTDEQCSACGNKDRTIRVGEKGAGIDRVKKVDRHSVERRWKWLILLAITTFGGALLGVVLIGWIGVIVGLVLAIISWKIGPLAKTKARDTDHY